VSQARRTVTAGRAEHENLHRASQNDRSQTMRRNQVRTGQIIQLAHTHDPQSPKDLLMRGFRMQKIAETIGLPSCPPHSTKRARRRTPIHLLPLPVKRTSTHVAAPMLRQIAMLIKFTMRTLPVRDCQLDGIRQMTVREIHAINRIAANWRQI